MDCIRSDGFCFCAVGGGIAEKGAIQRGKSESRPKSLGNKQNAIRETNIVHFTMPLLLSTAILCSIYEMIQPLNSAALSSK